MKKVVNLEEEKSELNVIYPVTCLYNGQWDTDITLFGCTGNIGVKYTSIRKFFFLQFDRECVYLV